MSTVKFDTIVWFGRPMRKASDRYPDFVGQFRSPADGKRRKAGLWVGRGQVGVKLGTDVFFLECVGGAAPFAAGSVRFAGRRHDASLEAVKLGEDKDAVAFRLALRPV